MSLTRHDGSARFLRRALLALVALLAIAPAAAWAAPVTYAISSGSAVVRGSLAGQTESIFLGAPAISTPLADIRAVVDREVGPYGRLESLDLVANDFSVALDAAQTGLETLNVFSPSIHSLSGADLNAFGQFSLPTTVTADVTGTLLGGTPFGPESIASTANTGSAVGLLFASDDQILIQVTGITVAEFDPSVFGIQAPGAETIELKVDFQFVGQAVANPIPEPAAAVVFAVGLAIVGHRLNRFPPIEEDEDLL